MHHFHQLEKDNNRDFLLQQRVDPITGELIEAGHKIVICSSCKSAFFEESWQYLGGKHCNQTKTLSKIPITQTLWLKAKPLEFLPFDFEGFDTKFHYQDMIYGFLEFMTKLLSVTGIISSFIAFSQERYEIFFVLFPIAISLFTFLFNMEKVFKKLPSSIYKHIIPTHKEHKLAIDLKKQNFVFRNDFQELELPLDSIYKLHYTFKYIAEDTSRYKDMCDLRVNLGFSENGIYKTRIIITQLRKIYFYKWEEFLKRLPSNIETTNS